VRRLKGKAENSLAVDHVACRSALCEAMTRVSSDSPGARRFLVLEGYRAFYDEATVCMLDVMLWLEVSKDTCCKRRMQTKPMPRREFERQLWPLHEDYMRTCFDGALQSTISARRVFVLNAEEAPLLVKQCALKAIWSCVSDK